MGWIQRSWIDASDQSLMIALARQFYGDNLHIMDLPYRLSSWAINNPENVALWFDEQQRFVAWAVLQTPFWSIDYSYDPGAGSNLHLEILAWADRRINAVSDSIYGRPAWFINVFSSQGERIRDLEKAGFKCQADVGENSWSKVLMQRENRAPVRVYRPPSGFIVRPLAGDREVEGYVELHRTVFESKNMTADWRRRALHHPCYRPDLDIVVESPDGRLAAFCIGWLDEALHEGQVEPLGCHPDYRRYALGRVALSEVLNRLQSLGAEKIQVETDSYRNTAFQLYESFDFQVAKNVLVFRKDYDDREKP